MIKSFKVIINLLVFYTLLLIITSCGNTKEISYFQRTPDGRDTIRVAPNYVVKIAPGDILDVYITSLSSAASSFFNPYANGNIPQDQTTIGGGSFDASSSTRLAQQGTPGHLVDQAGMIEIPIIGQIKAAGYSTMELRNIIRDKLGKLLKGPIVDVRLLNFKISVTGEVNRPASYVIPNEQVTLPEALTMAGDLTIYGKRTNVMVIRDVNGLKEFGNVDITRRDFFNSPYYYLHPNDIVYVEPIKTRGLQTDRTNAILPVLFSAVSLLVVIVTNIHFK
jgi:polysaccharide export outer membrane protein